jgi:hypothetical protein
MIQEQAQQRNVQLLLDVRVEFDGEQPIREECPLLWTGDGKQDYGNPRIS